MTTAFDSILLGIEQTAFQVECNILPIVVLTVNIYALTTIEQLHYRVITPK